VVHHGVDAPAPAEPAQEADVRERLGLGGRKVVLCVASKRPHKNQELLVRAAKRLPEDVAIVLAGHPEPYDAELRRLATGIGVAVHLGRGGARNLGRLRPGARRVIEVGLNLVFLVPGETGGMETAARETIPRLAAIEDVRLTLLVNREAAGSFDGIAEEV